MRERNAIGTHVSHPPEQNLTHGNHPPQQTSPVSTSPLEGSSAPTLGNRIRSHYPPINCVRSSLTTSRLTGRQG
eukprot:4715521-Amphidinium_carterae.1